MTSFPSTVIFWGAGATSSLGMRETKHQSAFIRDLVARPKDSPREPLRQRIQKALGDNAAVPWVSALSDLLTILGDQADGESFVATVAAEQIDAMRRNWLSGSDVEELRERIIELRILYNWPALEAITRICLSGKDDVFRLTKLFNILDMHGHSGLGFQGPQEEFLTLQQVTGARNALKMLLQAMFYIDWHQLCSSDSRHRENLEHHYDFAEALGRRMQRQGQKLAGSAAYDSKEFYMADVSFASMNYDPIALWFQFVANRDLNRNPSVPHVDSPTHKLQIYHDLGHFVATRRVVKKTDVGLWHPMNQSSAQRLNDPDHGANERARISKFLFPHGCLCWRLECGRALSELTGVRSMKQAHGIEDSQGAKFHHHSAKGGGSRSLISESIADELSDGVGG